RSTARFATQRQKRTKTTPIGSDVHVISVVPVRISEAATHQEMRTIRSSAIPMARGVRPGGPEPGAGVLLASAPCGPGPLVAAATRTDYAGGEGDSWNGWGGGQQAPTPTPR